jgi:hypothetical protein
MNELFSDIGRLKLGNALLPYKYVKWVLSDGITKIRAEFLCTARWITVQRMNNEKGGYQPSSSH